MKARRCKECESGSKRPAPHPGPRCSTHHRERLKAARKAAHEARVGKVYGLKPGQYEALYEAQGGVCFICRLATGKTRRLAVDHDHKTGYVRGLLCKPCNSMLAHARDSVDMLERAIRHITEPPAFDIIGKVKPDEQER